MSAQEALVAADVQVNSYQEGRLVHGDLSVSECRFARLSGSVHIGIAGAAEGGYNHAAEALQGVRHAAFTPLSIEDDEDGQEGCSRLQTHLLLIAGD